MWRDPFYVDFDIFIILDDVPLYFMQMETPVPAGHHFILPVMIQRSDQVLHRELIALLSKVVSGLSRLCVFAAIHVYS